MKALVITLRGCHLGYLGCYGNPWIATPVLDQLAAQGVVFDSHFAEVPETEAARKSWRDGQNHFPTVTPSPTTFDMISTLKEAGVTTVLVADGSRPIPDAFLQGWDECEVVRDDGPPLERTLEVAHEALEGLATQERWLLWVDLATLLPPWDAPADFTNSYFQMSREEELEEPEDPEDVQDPQDLSESPPPEEDPLTPWNDPPNGPINTEDDIDFCRLQYSYAGPMSYLDAGIGVLLEELEQLGLTNECLVLVTSDHGQALGEHGFVGPCQPSPHEELVHVPLLLRWPGQTASGHRVACLTQHVDLAPTLLAAFDVAPSSSLLGFNLRPLVEGGTECVRPHACSVMAVEKATAACLRTPTWAFFLPLTTSPDDVFGNPRLYVKPDDRWEVNDVVQHHIEQAEELERTLRNLLSLTKQEAN